MSMWIRKAPFGIRAGSGRTVTRDRPRSHTVWQLAPNSSSQPACSRPPKSSAQGITPRPPHRHHGGIGGAAHPGAPRVRLGVARGRAARAGSPVLLLFLGGVGGAPRAPRVRRRGRWSRDWEDRPRPRRRRRGRGDGRRAASAHVRRRVSCLRPPQSHQFCK